MGNEINNQFTDEDQKYFNALNNEILAFKTEIMLMFDLFSKENIKIISLPLYNNCFETIKYAKQLFS